MKMRKNNVYEDAKYLRKYRGFSALSERRRKQISSLGGKAAHAAGTAHVFNSRTAAAAGRKGGLSAWRKGVAHRFTHAEAVVAGKKGGRRNPLFPVGSRVYDNFSKVTSEVVGHTGDGGYKLRCLGKPPSGTWGSIKVGDVYLRDAHFVKNKVNPKKRTRRNPREAAWATVEYTAPGEALLLVKSTSGKGIGGDIIREKRAPRWVLYERASQLAEAYAQRAHLPLERISQVN